MATNSSTIDSIPVGAQPVSGSAGESAAPAVSAPARQGTDLPQTASEAPLGGLEAGQDVSFADQVKGHAKMFAGKVFQNDKEVQQGAARIAGEDEVGKRA